MGKVKLGSYSPLPIIPIVLVGANVNEKPNYMAVGFVSGVSSNPGVVMVSLGKKHHTTKGIIQNGTFSINIPSAEQVIETDYCGIVSGKTVDKSEIFTTFYGELETAPMIEECPITCECELIDKKEFARNFAYFGQVHQVYGIDKKYDISKANPMIRSTNDNLYRSVGESLGAGWKIGWNYKETKIQIGPKLFIRGPYFRERKEFEVIGIEDIGKEGKRCIPELWGKYIETITKMPNIDTSYGFEIYMTTNWMSKKGGDHRIVGCTTKPILLNIDDDSFGESIYLKTESEDLPKGTVLIKIPAQKYAVFTHIGNADKFMETIRYIYEVWLPNNKKYERVPLAPDLAWYDIRFEPESDNSEFDWYIPIQEKSS